MTPCPYTIRSRTLISSLPVPGAVTIAPQEKSPLKRKVRHLLYRDPSFHIGLLEYPSAIHPGGVNGEWHSASLPPRRLAVGGLSAPHTPPPPSCPGSPRRHYLSLTLAGHRPLGSRTEPALGTRPCQRAPRAASSHTTMAAQTNPSISVLGQRPRTSGCSCSKERRVEVATVDRPRRPPARAEVADRTGPGVDALVVTGDVVETRDNFKRSMGVLRARFEAVFYVPGNHDLWILPSPFLALQLQARCLTKCLAVAVLA